MISIRHRYFTVLIFVFLFPILSLGLDTKERDSLIRNVNYSKIDSLIYKSLHRLSTIYLLDNVLDSAKYYAEWMHRRADQDKSELWYASYCNLKGNIFRFEYNYDSALVNYTRAGRIAIEHRDFIRSANIFNNLGLLFETFGKWNSAVRIYKASASLFKAMGDKKGEANCCNNLGNVYETLGDYEKALQFHFQALPLYEAIEFDTGIARSANNIANVFANQKQYNKAHEYYLRSLKVKNPDVDMEGIFETYVNIGINFAVRDNFDSAYAYFNKAKVLCDKYGFSDLLPNLLENIGNLELKQKKYPEALKQLKEGLRLANQYGDSLQAIYINTSIGNLYLESGDYNNAEEVLLEAFNNIQRYGISELEVNGASNLTTLYEKRNNAEKAYYYYKKLIAAEKNQNVEASKRFADKAELKHQYERDVFEMKKEQEKRELVTQEEKKRQNMLLLGISMICLIIVVFSIMLYKRFKVSEQQKKIIAQQKHEVERQHHSLEEKNKEILDSINYAKRIQQALLANDDLLKQNLQEYFVFFKPKDIVSGDFYWATFVEPSSFNRSSNFYIAVCDSTGHGVPGAFMSLLNTNLLNEAINEKHIYEPGKIFNHVRQGLIKNISQDGQRDGMDGILLRVERMGEKSELTYSAANNAPVLITDGTINELSKDKMPVGIGISHDSFQSFSIETKKGDMLYLYTDGYADQFGGPKGKKFKYKTLNELLLSISNLPVAEQKIKLNKVFEEWRGLLEQVDDVCIIGIRI